MEVKLHLVTATLVLPLIENGYGNYWTGKDVAEMNHGEILDFCSKWELLEDYQSLMWRNDPKEIVIKIKADD